MTAKNFFTHPATITIGSLLIIGGILSLIGYNYWGWFGGSASLFDNKCTKGGGKIIKSGESCDFLDCDKTKYSCSMYS